MAYTDNSTKKDLVLIVGDYPQKVTENLVKTVQELDYKILPAHIGSFKSGEQNCEFYKNQKYLFVQNKAEITGSIVHVIADIGTDINKFCINTINAIATAKEYRAKSVHVILPFAPFARQDRRFEKRMVSVMGKTLPKMLKAAGATCISTFDMHSKASEAFYTKTFGSKNVKFLSAIDLFGEEVKTAAKGLGKVQVGGPDGYDKPEDMAQTKARKIEKKINGNEWTDYPNLFGIIKHHISESDTCAKFSVGHVENCATLVIDDMVDTGGTLKNAAFLLKEQKAAMTLTAVTHPILSGDSLSKLTSETIDDQQNPIDKLIVTDSIMSIYEKVDGLSEEQKKRVQILSVMPLIKKALQPTIG